MFVAGPSLAAAGVSNPLDDPSFTVHDQNGALLAGNNNGQEDPGALDLTLNQLAPENAAEAATILYLPVGAYPQSRLALMVKCVRTR